MRKPRRDELWHSTPRGLILPRRPTLPTRRFIQKWAQVQCCCETETVTVCCPCQEPGEGECIHWLGMLIEGVAAGDCSMPYQFDGRGEARYIPWEMDVETPCDFAGETWYSHFWLCPQSYWYMADAFTARLLKTGSTYQWEATYSLAEQSYIPFPTQTATYYSEVLTVKPTTCQTTYPCTLYSVEGPNFLDLSGTSLTVGPASYD